MDEKVVELFLKTVYREVNNGNWFLVPRKDIRYDGKIVNYKQALIDLGIVKVKQVEYYLTSLKAIDCFNISRDYDRRRDFNDDIYEFRIMVNKMETYVKLTINNRGVVCISFHKSDSSRRIKK